MFDIDLAYPFSLGLVAAFNPCGFAMLPVYLSFFLGKNSDEETSSARNLLRALKVGAALTAGFVLVFGAFGVLTSTLVSSGSIIEYTPYVTVVMGVLLVPLGIAMVFFGFEPKLSIPRLERGGDSGELWSMFMFGISYAVVSLGCTAPLFFLGVTSVFTSDGFVDGVMVFIAYALGMGAVIQVLTVAVAMARTSIANNMRKVLPLVNRISGVLLILGGAYLVIYGWYEIQVFRGNFPDNRLVKFFEDFRTDVTIWIEETGPSRLGIAMLLIVGAAFLRAFWDRPDRQSRLGALGGLSLVWVLAEFVVSWNGERPNLFILPAVRTIVSIPERVGNWFTDPWRWGTLGELLVVAVVGVAIWFRVRGPELPEGSEEAPTMVGA